MNKTALFISLGIVLTLYNLVTDPVRQSVEAYLIENLNDPSSYEFVSLVPTDTITYLDNIERIKKAYEKRLTNNKGMRTLTADLSLMSLLRQEYRDKVSKDSLVIAEIDSIITALGDRVNEVACYEYAFTYRAKNAMGGLILSRSTLQITPEYNVLAIASTPEYKIKSPNNFPGYLEFGQRRTVYDRLIFDIRIQ